MHQRPSRLQRIRSRASFTISLPLGNGMTRASSPWWSNAPSNASYRCLRSMPRISASNSRRRDVFLRRVAKSAIPTSKIVAILPMTPIIFSALSWRLKDGYSAPRCRSAGASRQPVFKGCPPDPPLRLDSTLPTIEGLRLIVPYPARRRQVECRLTRASNGAQCFP